MFELIRANQRRSRWLSGLMLLLLLGVGAAIGFSVYPNPAIWVRGVGLLPVPPQGASDFRGGWIVFPGPMAGAGLAVVIWIFQTLMFYVSGDGIMMAAAGARELSREDHPQLFNVVEEMRLAANLPQMPRVFLIEDAGMNAFAAGRDPQHAAVAVTSGLLMRLNRDQLQGVVAHEMSHILHRDVSYMTRLAIMAGTIVMLCELFLRMTIHGSSSTRRYRGKGSQQGAVILVMLIVAVILWLVAPLLARMIYLACSRRREYLADLGGAVLTRNPEALASALEVISGNAALERVSGVTAPMFIVNPAVSGEQAFSRWTSTHPPVEDRIRLLRSLAGGRVPVDFGGRLSNREREAVNWWTRRMMERLNPESGNKSSADREQSDAARSMIGQVVQGAAAGAGVAVGEGPRQETVETGESDLDRLRRTREVQDLMRKLNGFRFIACPCGARLKIPPDFRHERVRCPRCRAVHAINEAQPLPVRNAETK